MTKQIPIATICIAAGAALAASPSGASWAPTSGRAAAAPRQASSVMVPWTEKIREVIRNAHNKLHRRTYSLENPISVENAMLYFMEDYLAEGFDPDLTAAELLEGRADIVEMHCLLLAPGDATDPAVVDELLALCPAMIVELGGSTADLNCD